MKSTIILTGIGCFLPLLAVFNLFFGWIFLGFFYWLLAEAGLVAIIALSGYLTARRLSRTPRNNKKVIDVEAKLD